MKSSVFDTVVEPPPKPARHSQQTSTVKLPAIHDKKKESSLAADRPEAPPREGLRKQSFSLPRDSSHARSSSPKLPSREASDFLPSSVKQRRLEERSELRDRATRLVDAARREAQDTHERLKRDFAMETQNPEIEQDRKRRNKKVVDLHKYVKAKYKVIR